MQRLCPLREISIQFHIFEARDFRVYGWGQQSVMKTIIYII